MTGSFADDQTLPNKLPDKPAQLLFSEASRPKTLVECLTDAVEGGSSVQLIEYEVRFFVQFEIAQRDGILDTPRRAALRLEWDAPQVSALPPRQTL